MMPVAWALALAQVVVPSGEGLSVDQRIALLSASASRDAGRIERTVYRDPALRAEIRRVGFVRGCEAAGLAGREVRDRHAEALQAALAAAIRTAIPARILAEARVISFLANPLAIYSRRVEEALGRSSGPLLAELGDDMLRTFLIRTRSMRTTTNPADNRIEPKGDVAAALGLGEFYDLESPTQLALACSEQRIPRHLRPTITTGATPR